MTYTDDELLDALRAFADEYGRPPKLPEANERTSEGFPSAQTFVNHFGSWSTALTKAGFSPRNPTEYQSDAELLADLRALADERGACPTYAMVLDHEDTAAPETYRNRFGSWNEALDTAGLPTFPANAQEDGGKDGETA